VERLGTKSSKSLLERYVIIEMVISVPYHGNYCGPGWSAGVRQASVAGALAPAVDAFDETCREHDAAYALGQDVGLADAKFVKSNLGRGVKRSVAAIAVWGNSTYRSFLHGANLTDGIFIPVSMAPSKMSRSSIAQFSPPTIVGTGIRLSEPMVVNTKTGIVVTGSEMISVSRANTQVSTWDIVTQLRLSPVHYGSGRLGRFCQLYEEFKFLKASLAYVTACGTATLGNIIVEYMSNSAEPVRHFGASSFLQGVMSSGNGTLMPIWKNFTLEIPLMDTKFHPIASDLTYPDQNDASAGDVIVYNNNLVASQPAGFFVLNYAIEFRGATLTNRTTAIPYPSGVNSNWFYTSLRCVYNADGNVNTTPASGDQLSAGPVLASDAVWLPDSVYKVVIASAPQPGAGNSLTVGGVVQAAGSSNSLAIATRRGFIPIPNFSLAANAYGYTLYMSTAGQTIGTALAPVGSLFTSLAGALGNGGDGAGTLGTIADISKGSLIIYNTGGALTNFALDFSNVWMCLISQSSANQQSTS